MYLKENFNPKTIFLAPQRYNKPFNQPRKTGSNVNIPVILSHFKFLISNLCQ